MSGGDDQDESQKIFDPTPQKLQKAREKGEVAKSVDLMVAAAYAGLLLARSIAPWFVVRAALVIIAIIAQRAFVMAPTKLEPKMSRISIMQNAKNKFGRSGLFEFFKSFAKLVLYSICLGLFLSVSLPDMIGAMHGGPFITSALLAELCMQFMFLVVLIAAGLGVIDAVFQQFEHQRKNRMTRKEVMDEMKDSEGDPQMKSQRRQRAQEIAGSQMLADVPKADVIVVNPTHYAVALKWDRQPGTAPICVAKGVDEMAATIRRLAAEAGVPIHRDPPTARALHETAELGQEISPDHYAPVAAAIRFAEDMRRKAKEGI